MPITLDLPPEIECRLREELPDLDTDAKEAVALDLFRKEKITHFELGQMLGLDRFETDSFLKARQEFAQSLSIDDLERDYQTIRQLMAVSGR